MTEQEWLACDDPARMLYYLEGSPPSQPARISDRKLRLFAVACCRQVFGQFTDVRCLRAVEVAERYADGEATEQERAIASSDVGESLREPAAFGDCPERYARWAARWVSRSEQQVQECIADLESLGQSPIVQAALLRDVVGNPFRPIYTTAILRCAICGQTGHTEQNVRHAQIRSIAQAIYSDRDFSAMPVLHDALEDADCNNEDILRHCRGQQRCAACLGAGVVLIGRGEPSQGREETQCLGCQGAGWVHAGPHCRGCWVIDLILGKE